MQVKPARTVVIILRRHTETEQSSSGLNTSGSGSRFDYLIMQVYAQMEDVDSLMEKETLWCLG